MRNNLINNYLTSVQTLSIFFTQILTNISTLLLFVDIKLFDTLSIWYTLNYADQYWFIYSTKNTLYTNR